MARTSKISPNPAAEYPLKTKGSRFAEQTRAKANHLTKTEREEHLKKAMVMIYGKTQKAAGFDTNLLFDLASGSDIAHSFREAFQQKGYSLEAGPTVLIEAHYLHKHGIPAQRRLATIALAKLLQWKIQPFDLNPVEHGIAEQFCLRLHRKGLLPDEEINDGLILAETALAEIPVLVTSDKHLLNIEESQLRICFDDADLPMVSCFHPRKLVQALR